MKRKQPDKVVLVLALLCVATAATAFLIRTELPDDASAVAAANASADAAVPPPTAPEARERKSREAYAEMLRRPLFNATRRPVVAEADAQEEAATTALHGPLTGQHELVGVVIIDDREFALIRDPATRQTERVTVGGEISGWNVTSLTPDSATLEQRGETRTIKLERKSSPQDAARRKAELQQRLARRTAAARAANATAQAPGAHVVEEAVQNDGNAASPETQDDATAEDSPENDDS